MSEAELKEALRLGIIAPSYVRNATGWSGASVTRFKTDDSRKISEFKLQAVNDQLKKDGFKISKVK